MERNEIEEARLKQGMTYKELAEKSQISISTVQRYCRGGVKSPSVEVMNALKKALGLCSEEETETREEPPGEESACNVIEAMKKEHQQEIERIKAETERIISDRDRQILRIRVEKYICASIAVIMAAIFVGMTIYDNTHLDRGWIRHDNTEYIAETE